MLLLFVSAAFGAGAGTMREWVVRQIRDVRLESIDVTDIRYIVQSCIFENLRNWEVDPTYGTGGGAVKLCSYSNAHLESNHNLFCNCSTVNGRNGGALLFECRNGTVLMFRTCGHSCDAVYGAFVTVIFEYAEVNESTYLHCGRYDVPDRWSTTSLNSGKVIFQNHNSSYNSIQKTGGGFGTAGLRGLLARFTTCSSNTAANIMNTRQGVKQEYIREDMEYCNFLNNSLTECFAKSQGNPKFYMSNCVFMRNNLAAGGKLLAAGEIDGSAGKMYVTDCYFDKAVSTSGTVTFSTVKPQPGVTHRLEHLETQKCKAEYPFPTETFTAHVWEDERESSHVIYGLFWQVIELF